MMSLSGRPVGRGMVVVLFMLIFYPTALTSLHFPVVADYLNLFCFLSTVGIFFLIKQTNFFLFGKFEVFLLLCEFMVDFSC